MLWDLLARLRLIYPRETYLLRVRERTLRKWRTDKLVHLRSAPYLVIREEEVREEELRNIWGEPIGTLPDELRERRLRHTGETE